MAARCVFVVALPFLLVTDLVYGFRTKTTLQPDEEAQEKKNDGVYRPEGATAETPLERTDEIARKCHQWQLQDVEGAAAGNAEVLFLGDSMVEALRGTEKCEELRDPKKGLDYFSLKALITHFSGFDKKESAKQVLDDMNKNVAKSYVLAVGNDEIQHVLWRIRNGELHPNLQPKVIFVHAGFNNIGHGFDAEDALAGMKLVIAELKKARPNARILIHNTLPVVKTKKIEGKFKLAYEEWLQQLERAGQLFKGLEDEAAGISYVDCSKVFSTGKDPTGRNLYGKKEFFNPDGIHPNLEGHKKWAVCYRPYIVKELAKASSARVDTTHQ